MGVKCVKMSVKRCRSRSVCTERVETKLDVGKNSYVAVDATRCDGRVVWHVDALRAVNTHKAIRHLQRYDIKAYGRNGKRGT